MNKQKSLNIRLEEFINEDQFLAIRALTQGNANESQQKLAITTLMLNIGGFYQGSFDQDNAQNTIFNEGRRWIARFIYEVGIAPATYFRRETPNKRPNINKK